MSDAPDLRKAKRDRNGQSGNGKPDVSRLPPNSLEGEQAVLGCIMLNPDATLPDCIVSLPPEAMYDLRHRTIYETMIAMHDAREPVDAVTLMLKLRDGGKLDGIGGMGYLSSLPEKAPSAGAIDYYRQIVAEKFRIRRLIQIASCVVSDLYENEQEVEEVVDKAERDLLRMSSNFGQKPIPPMVEIVSRAITTIEQLHQNNGAITGLSTGFVDLDKLTTGFHGGEMIVIAARPGYGKTSIAMNIAEKVSVDDRIPVGVFSLEMTIDSLMLRMLCSRARVNIRNIREGFLAERDFPRLTGAAAKMAGAPLYIDDSSGTSIMQLRSKARRMASQYGIKLFIVDYLQLLNSSNRKVDNRQQEIADISGGLKGLAKELDLPIIVLSQLNREIERDGKRRPRLSDLRESGAIEQDSDFVGLLYRPSKEEKEEEDEGYRDCVPINMLVAKQRSGPSGVDVAFTFIRSMTRFESAAKISDDQVSLPYNDK